MTTLEMYEINSKNYTKSGRLTKRAKTEWAMTLSDNDMNTNAQIAESIVRNRSVESVESPYFFTHLILNADGKRYAIYENVLVAGQYIMTSPSKLRDALQAIITKK